MTSVMALLSSESYDTVGGMHDGSVHVDAGTMTGASEPRARVAHCSIRSDTSRTKLCTWITRIGIAYQCHTSSLMFAIAMRM
jgi:hypothetical protein